MNIPIVEFDCLFHIGTLDASRRGEKFSESHEGHMLSVSSHPMAWRQIARIGGNPLNEITSEQCVKLLDIYRLLDDKHLKTAVEEWGVEQGLCERKEAWLAWFSGEEEGDWRYFTCRTKEEAQNCLEETDDVRENGKPLVECVEIIAGTKKLESLVNQSKLDECTDSIEMVAALWAELKYPELHGVWWEELLDVYGSSAPRGGIFPAKMNSLQFQRIDFSLAPDDEFAEIPRHTVLRNANRRAP